MVYKRTIIVLLALLLFSVKLLSAQNIQRFTLNPNVSGSILALEYKNPALISMANEPYGGVKLLFPVSASFRLSNSKFVFADPISLLLLTDNLNGWLANMLLQSFALDGLSPKEVSVKLAEKLGDGLDLYAGLSAEYLRVGRQIHKSEHTSAILVSLSSYSSGVVHVPGEAFMLLFSEDEGLQKGNVIDFDKLYGAVKIVSQLKFSFGKTLKKGLEIRGMPVNLCWGVSGSYDMGHFMFELDMQDGFIHYDDNNVLTVYSDVKLKGAGLKLNDDMGFELRSGVGDLINGHGFSLGGSLSAYTKKFFLSLGLSDLGLMAWSDNVYTQGIEFSKDSISLSTLLSDTGSTELSVETEKGASVLDIGVAGFNLDFGFFSNNGNHIKALKYLSHGRAISFGFTQPFLSDYNENRRPVYNVVVQNEFIKGTLPLTLGWLLRDSNYYSSMFELRQVVTRGLSFSFRYIAQNSPVFHWKKGCEISVSSNFYFD